MFAGRKTLPVVFLTALILSLASCGNDNKPVGPTPTTTPVFHQITSLPTVTTWEKVWGTSASDLFLMGEAGYVYRGDGLTWTRELSTILTSRTVISAWGASPDNAYFVGRIANVEHVLTDTVADTPYYAYWDEPILENYNGITFSAVGISGIKWGLYDIWGSAFDDIFAVGYDGTIVHYNGTAWSVTYTGGTSPAWLNSVWGSSDSNVFVSGSHGTLLHYDGASWNVIPTHTGEHLWDVWGLSDTSVYLAGTNGLVLRYNGASIGSMTTPITNSLYSIWGSSENDLWAVGWGGKLLHCDGSAWTEVDSHTRFGLLSLWGTDASNIYAAGEIVLHYDGVDWTPVRVRNEPDFSDVWAGSESGVNEVVAVGTGGRIMKSVGADVFTSMTVDGGTATVDFSGVAGVTDTALFIVGDGGVILERDRSDLTNWLTASSGVSTDLNAVTAVSSSSAYAVGDGGVVLQYNGTDWTQITGLTTGNLNDVWAIAVAEDTSVWVVGDAGEAFLCVNGAWDTVATNTIENLRSVHGTSPTDIYAVGDNDTFVVLHPTEEGLPGSLGTGEDLTGVWSVYTTDGGRVFVSGANGVALVREGGTWRTLDSKVGMNLNGLYGLSTSNIFVVGEHNHILRYNP
jgi:photosystem II stability/assembly factor-like uncharacterized protein